MKAVANPFAPGAGAPPPELAGRDSILNDATLAIQRNKGGKSARSFIYVGLRGVGKTVLLNEVQAIAERENALTDLIEVSKNESLSVVIIAIMRAALLKLDRLKGVSEKVKQGLRVLKSFVGVVKVKYQDVEFSLDVDSETGIADSGTLTRDLAELFLATGEAAESRKSSIVILIDEIQNLPKEEFEALIMAVHRVDQKKLPILIVGAGLPLLVKLTGDAKSYAERLFEYPRIDALSPEDVRRALAEPLEESDVKINADAVDLIIEETKGYPYFVQEWGYQAWNAARKSPITRTDVKKCSKVAILRLDQNFFHSRYVRPSDPQKIYLRAMAELGPGPHKSGDVAKLLEKETSQLGPTRDSLIQNGMIYSPKYGYATFTVPLFDEFMKRTEPQFTP
jgi:hypothetical protein